MSAVDYWIDRAEAEYEARAAAGMFRLPKVREPRPERRVYVTRRKRMRAEKKNETGSRAERL